MKKLSLLIIIILTISCKYDFEDKTYNTTNTVSSIVISRKYTPSKRIYGYHYGYSFLKGKYCYHYGWYNKKSKYSTVFLTEEGDSIFLNSISIYNKYHINDTLLFNKKITINKTDSIVKSIDYTIYDK